MFTSYEWIYIVALIAVAVVFAVAVAQSIHDVVGMIRDNKWIPEDGAE